MALTYDGPVTAGDFSTSDFEIHDFDIPPSTISQNGPNGIVLVFPGDITSQDDLDYFGSVPGILTPQTVVLT